MKNTKYFLMGFLLLSTLAFASTVLAADYNIGVAKDDEVVTEIVSFNKDLADDYLGEDDIEKVIGDDAEVGAKKKTVVTKVEEDGDDWKVDLDEWDWTTEEFDEDADSDTTKTVKGDPDDLGKDVMSPPSIVPQDVASYLGEIDFKDDEDSVSISVEGTTVTITYAKDYAKFWMSDVEGDILVVYTYASQGYISNVKYQDEDGNVIYELSTGAIPGYELPILLGITAIGAIGLIYTVMKKK